MSITFRVENGPKQLTTYECHICAQLDEEGDTSARADSICGVCKGRGEYEVEEDIYSANFANATVVGFIYAATGAHEYCGRLTPAKVKAAIPLVKSTIYDPERRERLLRVFEWAAAHNKSISWS